MTQSILKINGNIVPRRTARRLRPDEIESPVELEKSRQFDETIRVQFGDSILLPILDASIELEEDDFIHEPKSAEDEVDDVIIIDDDPVDENDNLIFENRLIDILIDTGRNLPLGKNNHPVKVRKRSLNKNGEEIGEYNDNPILNAALYDVEFDDSTIRLYRANIIAQNLYEQIDGGDYFLTKLESITDFQKNKDASSINDIIIRTKSGQKRQRRSTKGWKLLVKLSDETTH